MINDENVKAIPHQEVVQKLRELNEDADSICLCVNREEDFNESEVYRSIYSYIQIS